MGWFTDWLVPDTRPSAGIRGKPFYWYDPTDAECDARSKLDKLAGVKMGPHVECGTCGYGGYGYQCKCDAKAGRPLRWWES